jgi:hypothetical protein
MDRVSNTYAMKPENGRGPLLGGEVRCIPSFPGSWSSGRDLLFA